MRDRDKRIQEQFDWEDSFNKRLSGVGGGIGELEGMEKARETMELTGKADEDMLREKVEEKERLGCEPVNSSLNPKCGKSKSD